MSQLQDAARALIVAQARLEAFDRRWAGSSFKSKDHERGRLVGDVERAQLAYLELSLTSDGPSGATLESKPIMRRRRSGPEPIVTRERVERTRDELAVDGKRAPGPTAIARALNVHVSTVRRRLRDKPDN